MAKAKSESLPNKALYTRVSYLHQAASYMAAVQPPPKTADPKPTLSRPHDDAADADADAQSNDSQEKKEKMTKRQQQRRKTSSETALARRLVSDIRAVSLKAQIRPSPAVKQMMCRYCDALLVEGRTCSTTVENASRGGRKPWADVMVTRCATCGYAKRFPVSAPRQKRRPFRVADSADGLDADADADADANADGAVSEKPGGSG